MSTINNVKKIFRFKLSHDVSGALELFTNAHRFNLRNEIKIAWREWCDSNDILIQNETRRLENLGYTGNIVKKMWTSVRYYHMKKVNKTICGIVDGERVTGSANEEKTRRKYITYDDKTFLALIDQHIEKHHTNDTFTPARGYDMFLESYHTNINTVIKVLIDKGLSKDDVDFKLKKTYKNRYFNIVKLYERT
jgi:hypothetical protein